MISLSSFLRRGRLAAAVSLIVGGIVCVGCDVSTSSSGEKDPVASTSPGEKDPVASPMDTAFAAGQSVVCTYTHEAYDATVTLRSKDVFRIDQQTQGGLAHVIRGPEHALVWIDGMVDAMEFETDAYEQETSGLYPNFDPSEFDIDALFTDGTCQPDSAADDTVFELPVDMTSAPATP